MKSSKTVSSSSMNHSSEAIDNYDEENTNTSSSTVDFSLLRKPIVTSVTGFSEAKKAYDSGTDEIRKLLSNECDLIYECKVCRNVFRSLVNFISHKRVYCQTTFKSNQHFHFSNNEYIDQDISTIIQAENDFISQRNGSKSREPENRDLSAIVERLIKKQKTKRETNLSDFYEQLGKKLVQESNGVAAKEVPAMMNGSAGKNIVLQLNSVPESSAAVYQTLKRHKEDNIRDEVNEVHELLGKNTVVLDPNGKAISVSPVDTAVAGSSKQQDFKCEMCDEGFSTEKTLNIHIEKNHIPSTVVYQCPSCPMTFLQPSGVLQHLSNDHKNSQQSLRQAREKCNRGRRSDKIPKTKEQPPPATPTASQPDQQDDLKTWLGEFSDAVPSCPYCNKKIERKAALIAHVQACANQKETKPRKRSVTPKTPIQPKTETETADEASSHSCDTNVSKVSSTVTKPVNKRKRKGPLVIRNELPEVKDEVEQLWSSTSNGMLDPSQIKKEIDEEIAPLAQSSLIETPPVKKRKLKKVKEEKKGQEEVVKDIECPLCPKKVSETANLRRHVSMFHFRQNRFACKKCDFRGYRRIDTTNHLSSAHNIQGEKEEVNPFIEISIKEEDLCGPINTNVKCDPTLTLDGVMAMVIDQSVPEKVLKSITATSQIDLMDVSPTKSGENSGMSSPNSDKITSDGEGRRPTRNRIKPVCKDFVYDLNKIIKQEAEQHREQQNQQLLYPSRTRGRKSLENTPAKEEISETDKENVLDDGKSIKISEISGAALKMAQIEVMNQRACFHKPPEIPAERPFIPAKVSTPRRSDEKVIKVVPALLKDPTIAGKRGRKRTTEIKRVPSFTDQFLSSTGSDKKFKQRQEETDSEALAIFPKATTAPPALRAIKATKKLDLSNNEKSQLEMLQRLRNENDLAENGTKRKSQKPNIED
ncbi:zinc finger protein 800 [Culicoides brevitarsis]|uniref:zinc finger protein 800 n=1 Tax=Culicoides brevitarsis TaxID=469753 RepID=UPI00307B39BC